MEKRKILITGRRGAGKSTLIRRLLAETTLPVNGFVTKRLAAADAEGMYPVYLHPATQSEAERQFTPDNLIGRCDRMRHDIHPEVFDTLGVELARPRPGHLLVMDELGFMESEAMVFRSAVLSALDAEGYVLAALRDMDTAFLRQVRSHGAALQVELTRENREALFQQLREIVSHWK